MENKELKFEDAITRLEEIVSELEKEKLELDKSIELFEEGIRLSKFCKKQLEEAEQKIEIILKKEVKDSEISEKNTSEEYEVKSLFEVFPNTKS